MNGENELDKLFSHFQDPYLGAGYLNNRWAKRLSRRENQYKRFNKYTSGVNLMRAIFNAPLTLKEKESLLLERGELLGASPDYIKNHLYLLKGEGELKNLGINFLGTVLSRNKLQVCKNLKTLKIIYLNFNKNISNKKLIDLALDGVAL